MLNRYRQFTINKIIIASVRDTGISADTVKGAPTFPELWKKIEPYLSDGILTAHNAVFDMGVLKKVPDRLRH